MALRSLDDHHRIRRQQWAGEECFENGLSLTRCVGRIDEDQIGEGEPGVGVGDELERLQAHVRERFLELDEHARKARSAVFRLEAGALRTFYELQEQRHG